MVNPFSGPPFTLASQHRQDHCPSCMPMLGSTLEARCAGSQAATSATTVSSSAVAARMRGSDGLTSNASDDSQRPSTRAPPRPPASPSRGRRRPGGSTSARTCAAVAPSAMRIPISVRALAHRVGEHAVETERREHQRHARERAHQHERESFAARVRGRPRRPSLPPGARRARDRAAPPPRAPARSICSGGTIGGHDLGQRPVPVAGELSMGVIDGQRRRAVDVERDVADDADDLHLAPAGGDPLADDAVERHAGKRLPREVGADHGAARRAGIVAVVEARGRPGAECPSAAKAVAADDALLNAKPLLVESAVPARGPRADLRVPGVIAAGRRKTRDAACRGHARESTRVAPASSSWNSARRSARIGRSAGSPRRSGRARRGTPRSTCCSRWKLAMSTPAPTSSVSASASCAAASALRSRALPAGAGGGSRLLAQRVDWRRAARGGAPAPRRRRRRWRPSSPARNPRTAGSKPISSSRGSASRPRSLSTRHAERTPARVRAAAEAGEEQALDQQSAGRAARGPIRARSEPRTREPGRSRARARGWRR